ncbi:sodium channel protein Nach-like [Formica exsecta]|uniref:sodium channel protein Nach-like n=1 Tax=Formica exsecta TaxID=72781 RepID=UPI0011419606|nr:sodium channel protein Nach-like [Formica exsecta]
MMLNVSRAKRHAVNRIIVDQVDVVKKINDRLFDHSNIESYDDQSTESTKQIARHFLLEYLYDSSLHGVKYFRNLRGIKSTALGKIFWTLIMMCSFAFLSWMFWKTWIRYSTNPTRTVIQSFYNPIAIVPFPAVTVCPLVSPLRARREEVLRSLQLPPNMDNKTAMFLLKYGPSFANEHVASGRKYLKDLQALLKINHMTLLNFLKLLRPCEDLFEYCWWDGNAKNCSELFKISYTHSGICCSFNYILEDDIQIGRAREYTDFLRSVLFGPRVGLIAVSKRDLIVNSDGMGDKPIEFATNSIGLLIFTHHPQDFVGPISTRQILQANQELRIATIPTRKEKLAGYYYRNERGELVPHCADKKTELKYFPAYRYLNCFTSCSIRAVLKACDCLPYYYTPIANKYSLRICEWQDFECLNANIHHTRIIHNTVEKNFTCECRNPCTNTYYKTRTSSLLLNGVHDFNILPIYTNLTKSQAVLRVYFNTEIFIQMNTIPIADELYLLASVGGIFSLCLGASFISAVEIFYFIELFFRSYYKEKKSK